MIQRINNYLLTRYPLIWNTRLLWVSAVNLLLHLFFFLGGFSALSATSISDYYSVSSVGGSGMNALSFLCSLLVLVLWCVFYLRNNAFKNFYRIGKWWLAKEFVIVFFLVAITISYFISFNWGVRSRVRSITSQQQLVQEVNAVNTAGVYLPYEKTEYFALNTCAEKDRRSQYNGGQTEITNIDSAHLYDNLTDSSISGEKREQDTRIRMALRRPDAFSYLHYCNSLLSVSEAESQESISGKNQRWLRQGRKDSVQAAMQSLFTVLTKYGINYRLLVDTTLRDVFSDPLFSVDMTVGDRASTFQDGIEIKSPFYMERDNLRKAFNLIEDCQLTKENLGQRLKEWQFISYTTLGISILMLCYRRFSRKVFLVSVVGTLIWSVLIGLLAFGIDSEEAFFVIILILSAAFPAIGLWLLRQKSNKTLTGVLLNWHAFITPFIIPCIVALIQLYYNEQQYHGFYSTGSDEILRRQFPVSYWVTSHFGIIFFVNLIVGFIYMALLFNRWAKQWQAAPEE